MSPKRWNLRKYGLDEKSYRKMQEAQAGLCLICGLPETASHRGKTKSLSVDHDHFSGKVRGLLCGRCNQTLGRVKDNPMLLRRMAEYLENKVTAPPLHSSLLTEVQKFTTALSRLPSILQEVAEDVFVLKLTQKEIADKRKRNQTWVSHQVCLIFKFLSQQSPCMPFFTREPRKKATQLSLAERQAALKERLRAT